MRKLFILTAATLSLSGCAFFKLTPDQQAAKIQADEAKVVYFAKAAGCVAQDVSATAQNLGITTVLDDKGNAVLSKVDTVTGKVCSLTIPAAAVAAAPAAS